MRNVEFYKNKNVISNQVYFARKKAGLTQDQLAAQMQTWNVNITQQGISKIEMNQRLVTDYELAILCKILKVDITSMLKDFYEEYSEK